MGPEALIIAAAVRAGFAVVYTEDMQHGQAIDQSVYRLILHARPGAPRGILAYELNVHLYPICFFCWRRRSGGSGGLQGLRS